MQKIDSAMDYTEEKEKLYEGSPLEPMNDFVLVQRIVDAEVVKVGDIFLKDEATFVAPTAPRKKSDKAKVIAVGEGRIIGGSLVPINLQLGDTVFITKYGGTDVNIEDVEYVLVRCGEIYGRLRDNSAA
jgi:chaperonin GroES